MRFPQGPGRIYRACALAVLLARQALWPGQEVVMAFLGNAVVHTPVFNIKGRTLYSPGMLISIFLLLPVSVLFLYMAKNRERGRSPTDWAADVVLGAVPGFELMKLIDLMKEEGTAHAFKARTY
jgi:hypothetical protein